MQNTVLANNGNFMVSFTLDAVRFPLIYRCLQNIYWLKSEGICGFLVIFFEKMLLGLQPFINLQRQKKEKR